MPDSPSRELTIPQGAVWVESWRRRQNKQLITLPGGFGGSGILTWHGVDSSAVLTSGATGADVQAALEAIASIGAGQVLVTGSAGGPWLVEWLDRLAGSMQDLFVATPSTILVAKVYRDLTGFHARLQVRKTFDDPTALIDAQDAGGGTPQIVIDTTTNTIIMTILPADTEALDPAAFPTAPQAVYELHATPPLLPAERWEHGTVKLSRGVIR